MLPIGREPTATRRLGISMRHLCLMGEGSCLGELENLPSPTWSLFSRKHINLVQTAQELYTTFAKDLVRCNGMFKVTLSWWDAPALALFHPRGEQHLHKEGLQPTTSSAALSSEQQCSTHVMAKGSRGQKGRDSTNSFLKIHISVQEGGLQLSQVRLQKRKTRKRPRELCASRTTTDQHPRLFTVLKRAFRQKL